MTGTEFISAAFAGMLNTLWIALAIALTAWALGRFLLRTNSATRHLLWWTVLALVLMLPLAAIDFAPHAASPDIQAAVASPAAPGAPVSASVPAQSPASSFPLEIEAGDWIQIAIAVWLLFAGLQLVRVTWSFAHLRKLKNKSLGASPALEQRLRYWLAACGIRRPVRLLVSDDIASPLATGFRHPAVILPAALLDHFQKDELDHVMLHELAHVARRDDWTNLLARVFGALAGLHPIAAWILRQIARERELACDDWVVARTGEARPYAASLARLFEVCRSRRRVVLATGMAENASRLGERIESLLANGRSFSARTSLLRVGLAAMALVALMAAGAQAPHWVVLAQSSSDQTHPAKQVVNPRGSFLAALAAAGYGDLVVDDIIALKDHGIDAHFLADLSQTNWEKLSARTMIDMHDHGVPAEMLRALRDAGFQHIDMRDVINAWEQGVRPSTFKDAAQYGGHLTLAQIVKLKQAGVIQ